MLALIVISKVVIAHSAVKTKYSASEGLVALLEPFIDTVVICTMTALVILLSGAWMNPIDPATGERTKAVYTCSWQDQPMAMVDWQNLDERVSQNQTQAILSSLWLDHVFESLP